MGGWNWNQCSLNERVIQYTTVVSINWIAIFKEPYPFLEVILTTSHLSLDTFLTHQPILCFSTPSPAIHLLPWPWLPVQWPHCWGGGAYWGLRGHLWCGGELCGILHVQVCIYEQPAEMLPQVPLWARAWWEDFYQLWRLLYQTSRWHISSS